MIRRNRVKPIEYEITGNYCTATVYGMDGRITGEFVIDVMYLDKVKNHKWYIKYTNGNPVAVCGRVGREKVRLHHYLFGKPPFGLEYDHANTNPLDNRRKNLRFCTFAQNQRNRSTRHNNQSGYKGVHRVGNRWRARITYKNKDHHLGYFDTKKQAALAYNKAAIRLHEDFANLNEV